MARPYADGTASIQEQGTGVVHNIDGGSLVWASEGGGEERQMGYEIKHRGSVDHEVLGDIAWVVYEYPEGAENMREHELNGHNLIKDFDWGLSDEPDE